MKNFDDLWLERKRATEVPVFFNDFYDIGKGFIQAISGELFCEPHSQIARTILDDFQVITSERPFEFPLRAFDMAYANRWQYVIPYGM